jgi:hypothetical protein
MLGVIGHFSTTLTQAFITPHFAFSMWDKRLRNGDFFCTNYAGRREEDRDGLLTKYASRGCNPVDPREVLDYQQGGGGFQQRRFSSTETGRLVSFATIPGMISRPDRVPAKISWNVEFGSPKLKMGTGKIERQDWVRFHRIVFDV